MKTILKASFSIRNYLPALPNVARHPHARHCTAMPWEEGSAQPGRPSREDRCLFLAATSGEQNQVPRGFWHSPAICPWSLCFGLAGTWLAGTWANLLSGVWTSPPLKKLLGEKAGDFPHPWAHHFFIQLPTTGKAVTSYTQFSIPSKPFPQI